jgi:hypothetical protein
VAGGGVAGQLAPQPAAEQQVAGQVAEQLCILSVANS